MRTRLLALALIPIAAANCRADVIPLDAPTEYHPGGSFEISVGLPPLQALGAYSLDVVIRSTVPVAGLLSVDPPQPSATGYVFGTLTALFVGTVTPTEFEYRVRLAGALPAGTRVDVLAGVNDHVSNLVVRTSADMTGPLRAFIDIASVHVDAAGQGETPIEVLPPRIIEQGSPVASPSAVPAPPGLVLAAVGGLLLFGRRAVRGRK